MYVARQDTLKQIKSRGLIAVIRAPSAEIALKMVEALIAGGVTGIEITYSTPNATAVLREVFEQYSAHCVIGMGTLSTPSQAEEAQEAGAQFLVSPHLDPDLAEAMRATDLLMMMGAFTPTEVMTSLRLGSDVVKLFPATPAGPEYLRELREPFPDIPLLPTGGITTENVDAWFKAGAIAVAAGTHLTPKDLALAGRYDEITAIARDYVEAVAAARGG